MNAKGIKTYALDNISTYLRFTEVIRRDLQHS